VLRSHYTDDTREACELETDVQLVPAAAAVEEEEGRKKTTQMLCKEQEEHQAAEVLFLGVCNK
jgi:hypothetical protein